MEQNNNTRRVISLLVDNSNGVLARISSLFCRRGFNIDSLTVSATNDPAVSRITVTLRGTEQALNQLILQTERLEVTRQIFELDPDKSLQRELLLLKVECDSQNRAELREISSIYKAKIIDLSPDSMIFELTGKPDKTRRLFDHVQGLQHSGALPHRRHRAGARRQARAHAEARAGGRGGAAAPAGYALPLSCS